MSADLAHELKAKTEERTTTRTRVRVVLAIGPVVALAGLAWALVQPWRLTLLHPHGQGLWWLLAEPPVYAALVGILFRLLVAPGLVADLEADR